MKNDTWILVPLPSDQKPITCKWIFKIRYKVDGNVAKYKACLVARGFSQIHGVDYGETYSHVVKITSIRVLLALATQLDLEVHQFDVKFVFLHGLLDAEVYMELPKGLKERGRIGLVCKLLKALYGQVNLHVLGTTN